MKVLVGCEESGTVREAFAKLGHDAWSCDILPSRQAGKHIQGDIIETLETNGFWDAIILHPDCTAMAVSGNKWYGVNMPYHNKRIQAVEWTVKLWKLAKQKSKSVALENPSSVIFPVLRKLGAQVAYIQPYQFGHLEQKRTGLALHGLEALKETKNVYDEMMLLPKNERERIFYMTPSDTRKRDRSTTYQGIAEAMAEQWGK